jgi:hypothetical protein
MTARPLWCGSRLLPTDATGVGIEIGVSQDLFAVSVNDGLGQRGAEGLKPIPQEVTQAV